MNLILIFYGIAVLIWTIFLFWTGDKKINPRMIVSLIFFAAFLSSLVHVLSIENWDLLSDAEILVLTFYVLVGLGGLLISYWVYKDGREIERLKGKVG